MVDIRKLQDAMNRQDQEGIVRELFPSLAAEQQYVQAEAQVLRILPVEEPEEFSQADQEEYNEWLDEIYVAEQLERESREADERRNDK